MDENNKNKCSKMLKKIFGSNFYFVHGSRAAYIKPILENSKIKISTDINNTYINFGGNEFAYCWIKYDDIPVGINDSPFLTSFFISPIILLNENVIFNSMWKGGPIQTEDLTNTKINHIIDKPYDFKKVFKTYYFSVYLNKDDSRETRLKKLKKIKKYLSFYNAIPENSPRYPSHHEFLFPNEIDLKKYLIGIDISYGNSTNWEDVAVKQILEEKYPNVKLFGYDASNKLEYFPKLMDICP
jgi:hypothetical protein